MLKYEYIGLADHSPSARVARGLDEKRVEQKIREFEKLKRVHADSQPKMLLGAEVDILSDGKLDYPDDILKRFDVVTASIHGAFRQSKDPNHRKAPRRDCQPSRSYHWPSNNTPDRQS